MGKKFAVNRKSGYYYVTLRDDTLENYYDYGKKSIYEDTVTISDELWGLERKMKKAKKRLEKRHRIVSNAIKDVPQSIQFIKKYKEKK